MSFRQGFYRLKTKTARSIVHLRKLLLQEKRQLTLCKKKIDSLPELLLPLGLIGALVFFAFAASLRLTGSLSQIFSPAVINEVASQLIIEEGFPHLNQQSDQEGSFKIAAERETPELTLAFNNTALVAEKINLSPQNAFTRTEIVEYEVQAGDTISTIAEKFGLTWSTILWENDLSSWSVIRPGDKLRILPVNGLTHTVKSGENISYLATKYKSSVEDIINVNNLNEQADLQIGQLIIIPDGTPPPTPQPVYQTTAPVFVEENPASYSAWRRETQCHRFYGGQCTDWAAYQWATEQGQCVPSWGNAKYWWDRAQRDGYQVGYTAQKGAIMFLTCTSWQCSYYGHVAYVEDFDEDTVTISEMNGPAGPWNAYVRTLNRTLSWQNGWKIIGYIYPK